MLPTRCQICSSLVESCWTYLHVILSLSLSLGGGYRPCRRHLWTLIILTVLSTCVRSNVVCIRIHSGCHSTKYHVTYGFQLPQWSIVIHYVFFCKEKRTNYLCLLPINTPSSCCSNCPHQDTFEWCPQVVVVSSILASVSMCRWSSDTFRSNDRDIRSRDRMLNCNRERRVWWSAPPSSTNGDGNDDFLVAVSAAANGWPCFRWESAFDSMRERGI